jgi:hypothetical protein
LDTSDFDRSSAACVPVPSYLQELIKRAADKVKQLAEKAAAVGMLEVYAAVRPQSQECRGQPSRCAIKRDSF